MNIIFEDYAGELTKDEKKELIGELKSENYSYLYYHFRNPSV